jgi:hypothetical protein
LQIRSSTALKGYNCNLLWPVHGMLRQAPRPAFHRARLICPLGQLLQNRVKPLAQKIILFFQNFESVVSSARPASLAEGHIEVVTNVRRDAVDTKALADEQRGRGRRSRVVLSVKPFFPRKTHIGTLGTTLGTISRPERAETS